MNLAYQAFDIVENGSLSGGLFTQTLTPRVTKDAVEKQREENDKLIAEEQRYRDAIADIRKKAREVQREEDIADFAQQREDLNEELEQSKEDLNEKLADIDKQVAEAQEELDSLTV